ncbi:lovastatin nonaketide synthase [Aspergillus ellipticus CBS 707.79]|uniref:Lovastatin nonaketide synthase n=1 Tax=Aspergillus ellipticus CBS 707.79 TaxID=1448320 RepID=A0A319DHW5_9EURO|nr:lovastatin nonaketide synthase [Aspergillus ellipticus CBS 707.79]
MAAILSNLPSSTSSTDSESDSLSSTGSTVLSAPMSDDLRPSTRVDNSAITGMACRVAGAENPRQLWDVLESRRDLQQKMPANRYNVDAFFHPQGTNKGTTNARYGYFLDQGLDQFDAQFFNISGREAQAMDPQQRLLLEVVYEAIEDAGITLDEISGSRTGVFVGSFTNDYSVQAQRNLEHYPKYSITGLTNSILANRISFFFNLHGPSYQLDTACSSSLTCLHLANQSLQTGESDIAIVCGSSLHFDPYMYTTMTDFGMLSIDGRSRAFDANGSGYVRGEGICVVVLKRIRDAEGKGDTIRAIIRGSAINHDGVKEGLTMPNPKAQAALIRETYKAAGLSTADTQYFEAHGTGTAAGDPRETNAIGSVFGPERSKPLYIGSLKTNLGHLEGASGIASVIKTVMMLEKAKLAPNLLFDTPNPQIDFERGKLKVVTEMMDWPATTGARRASINSFGFGGSNAHIILDSYSHARVIQARKSEDLFQRPFLLPLTSHSEKAGKNHVRRLLEYLQSHPDTAPADLAYSYSIRHTLHPYRSFAIGQQLSELTKDLTSPLPVAAWRRKGNPPVRLGFVFTGQGAQWFAMGRQLIEQCPLFRQTLEKCDRVLQRLPDAPNWSCMAELLKSSSDSRLAQSRFSQPLCTALQLSLVDLLRSWGITPSAVVGHSSGEIAAAYAAGILSFSNAIICAFYRGLYMSKGVGSTPGAMMAVGMTEADAVTTLQPYTGRITVAAINSPSSLTLSGDEDAIKELKAMLDEQKIFARQLQVEQAFHSHHMLPLAPGFRQALAQTSSFQPRLAKVPMFSSVTGRKSSARVMDGEYWAANMTGVVRFSDALTGILMGDDDEEAPALDVLVEIGPHPALKGPATQVLKSLGLDLPYVGSLDRKLAAYQSVLTCAGQLFALGYPVDLASVNAGHALDIRGKPEKQTVGQPLSDLPTYAWDHQSYWAETRTAQEFRLRKGGRHAVLGALVPGSPATHRRWQRYLRPRELPWLPEHAIDGKVIFPGAGYLSMALEAITSELAADAVQDIFIRDVTIKAALSISDSDSGTEAMIDLIQLDDQPAMPSSLPWSRFTVFSFEEDGKTVEHCTGLITALLAKEPTESWRSQYSFTELQAHTTQSQAPTRFYDRLYSVGLQYGDNFRLISDAIESGPGFAIAPMVYRPKNVINAPGDECILHPSFFDCALHPLFASLENRLGTPLDDSYIPTSIRSVRVSGALVRRKFDTQDQKFWVRADTERLGPRVNRSDVIIHDGDSATQLVNLQGLEVTGLGLGSSEADRNLFFRIQWNEAFGSQGVGEAPNFAGLADLLDCYAHEFPESVLLHSTSGVGKSQELLGRLLDPVRRRIQSFSVLAAEVEQKDIETALDSLYPGLRRPVERERFDIAVLDADSQDVVPLVKAGGFIVARENAEMAGVQRIFSTGEWTVWKKEASTREEHDIHLLLPSKPSEETLAISAAIKRSHSQPVHTSTLEKLSSQAKHIISLVSLDEDVLYDTTAENASQFDAIKAMLIAPSRNIVWLLNGATQEPVHPAQGLFTGLARTARNENETLRLVTLDTVDQADPDSISKFALHVLDPALDEEEFRLRDQKLWIPRIVPEERINRKLPNGPDRQPTKQAFANSSLALHITHPGQPDTLVYEEEEISEIGDHEIEIAVTASAVSHRDVAIVNGNVHENRLGETCVGKVSRLGSAVSIPLGTPVFAFAPHGSHRSLVRVPANLACPLPEIEMDATNVAALGQSLLVAHYALSEIAHLRAGEVCLILHNTSGLGHVAIQLAQAIGARVLVAVSAEEKEFVQQNLSLNPADVLVVSDMGSFSAVVRHATAGHGVDVILRPDASVTLTPAIGETLATAGRLVDMAIPSAPISTALLPPISSYMVVDLVAASRQDSRLGPRLVQEMTQYFQKQPAFSAPPVTVFGYSDASQAFKNSQIAAQMVLLAKPDEKVPVSPATYSSSRVLFQSDKTYLIVGGLGGIGRALSQWMFRRGARNFAFLSRSGARKPEAQATVDWLQQRRATVSVHCGDVSQETDVRACIQSIGDNLRGVIQAAMVLESCPLSEMTAPQWAAVIRPKAHGALNLHNATTNVPLDFFICFSSISAIIGFLAEANYSASNAYLDALTRWRRAQGLPGFAMNVGVVAEAGAIAEDASLRTIIDRMGMDVLTEQELFYQIEEALDGQRAAEKSDSWDAHQILSGINTRRTDLFWSKRSLFRSLYAGLDQATGSGDEEKQNLMEYLRLAGDAEKMHPVLLDAFSDCIANTLAVPRSIVQAGVPLAAYGMDSLVAVEFRKWFSKELGVNLALFDILGSKSTGELVAKSIESVTGDVIPVVKTRPVQIPMSNFQRRLWFMHNLTTDAASLNVSVSMIIHGEPQMSVLQQVWTELARRNESLRTGYFEGDDFAEQEILDESILLPIENADLSGAVSPEASLRQYAATLRGMPLDIESGQVIRSALVKWGEARYAWVFSIHHMAIDGGSKGSLMEQISGLYNAIAEGRSLESVRRPTLSYVDFTLWHEHQLQLPTIQEDLAWWRDQLAGAPATSKLLPFAQNDRPATASREREIVRDVIEPSVFKRMKRISSRLDATPFHFVLAALRAFLLRYTNDEDTTILVVNGERPHPSLESVLGFFVNMVPLRCQDGSDGTFDQLVSKMKTRTVEALARSQAPFDVIVETLGNAWSPGHFPLGQIAINYQIYAKAPHYPTTDFQIPEVRVEDMPTGFEIQLEVVENATSGLQFRLEFDSFLYRKTDMARFIQNFHTFVQTAVQDYRQPVEEMEMAGPLELERLRTNFWTEEVSPGADRGLSTWEQFAAQARANPGAQAIVTSGGSSISYQHLYARAEELARVLVEAGLTRGDRVGILGSASIDIIAAMLAAARLRIAYVPLDADFAAARLVHMIQDSSCIAVLFDKNLDSLVPKLQDETTARFVSLQSSISSTGLPMVGGSDDTGAYVIYTSGSTGLPKGIAITQESTRIMLDSWVESHQIAPKDVVLSTTSMCFDISVPQIWGPLIRGATLALALRPVRKDPRELARFVSTAGVTCASTTPTQFALLLEHGSAELQQCTQLRAIVLLGEALPTRLVQAIYALGLSATVFNEYGPSEATSQNTTYAVPNPPPSEENSVPVGHALPNSSLYVVDAQLRPVPAGVRGELCIGGGQVSPGYIGRPQKTKEVFFSNPFVQGPFESRGWTRLYRTGDQVRQLENGDIQFLGRIAGDTQIKLRGYRMDLGEIEHHITAHFNTPNAPFQARAVVLARYIVSDSGSMTDDRQLVAFLIPREPVPGYQDAINAAHEAIKQSMNHYMLPSCYQVLEKFPTLISGKMDRPALAKLSLDPVFPGITNTTAAAAVNQTSTSTETLDAVVGIFRTVLKLNDQPIQPTDSFFALGGQSVLALRLQALLKRKLKQTVTLMDIFDRPTPGQLASWFDSQSSTSPKAAPAIDWDNEINIPDTPEYHPTQKPSSSPPNDILVLGSDSFIGAFLLQALILAHPQSTIHVLGTESPLTPTDLQSLFDKYHLFTPSLTQTTLLRQTRSLPGALTQANLGLDTTEFLTLGPRLQSIYHTGGHVSLLQTYTDLHTCNVSSVLSMIRLSAQANPPSRLHYISTWSATHMQTWNTSIRSSAITNTETSLRSFYPPNSNASGYFKTRWVGERILENAAPRGFPVGIYRCAAHTAPLDSDIPTPADNFTLNLFLGMIRSRAVPAITPIPIENGNGQMEPTVNFLPIDYVVDRVVRLADATAPTTAQKGVDAGIFHINNPSPLPWSKYAEVIAQIRDDGQPGELLDVETWTKRMLQHAATEREKMEWETFREYLALGHVMFALDEKNTKEALGEQQQMVCPVVDKEYLRRLVEVQGQLKR